MLSSTPALRTTSFEPWPQMVSAGKSMFFTGYDVDLTVVKTGLPCQSEYA
jgi:hypothetical protein